MAVAPDYPFSHILKTFRYTLIVYMDDVLLVFFEDKVGT